MNNFLSNLSCLGVVLLSFNGVAQSVGNVGVNTETPTETLDVNGTARVQTLPTNGQVNAISTKSDGTRSASKDQTFNATKTMVVDDRGVLGVVNGLPLFKENSNVSYVKTVYSYTPINNDTPQNSVVGLGNLEVRFDGTNPNSTSSTFSIRLRSAQDLDNNSTTQDNVLVNGIKMGWGGGPWSRQHTVYPATVGNWYAIDSNDYLKVNVKNSDYMVLYVALLNSRELYRVSAVVNSPIGPESYNSYKSTLRSQAQVTIYLEKLTD